MPILHIQSGGEAVSPNGTRLQLTGAQALAIRGPIIEVSVGIEQSAGAGFAAERQELPSPRTGWALIDTGASITCVDDKAARELSLPVIDVAKVTSATHTEIDQNVYPIQITIVGSALQFNVARAMGAALEPLGIIAWIGRDVLSLCTLSYSGPTGQITLSL